MKPDISPGWPEIELSHNSPQLVIDPQFDIIRPAGDASDEDRKISELAGLIEQDGQLHPVSAYATKDVNGVITYHVYDGRRRVRAITQLNGDRAAKFKPLTPVRIQVNQDVTGADDLRLLRLAFQSNHARKGYSDGELAEIVHALRVRHNWIGEPGTKKVVKMLGIDQPRVSIADRVYALDEQVKKQLRDGRITTQVALELAKVNVAEQAKVLEHAAEFQFEENAKKPKGAKVAKADKAAAEAETETGTETESTAKESKKKAKLDDASTLPEKVEAPAVVKAIRAANENKPADEIVQVKKTRKELVETLQEFADSDLSGPEKGLARRFMTALLLNADGLLTDKKLANQWDKVVDAIAIAAKQIPDYAGPAGKTKVEKAEKADKPVAAVAKDKTVKATKAPKVTESPVAPAKEAEADKPTKTAKKTK